MWPLNSRLMNFPALLALLFFSLPTFAAEFGPASIWHPADDFRQQVIGDCGGAGARFGECFASRMKQAGAAPEALAFSTALSNEGYMRDFRSCGRVSIAAVTYPFRANENDGLLLVNGDPHLIDVDKIEQLPKDGLSQLVARNPKASLWPSARDKTDRIIAEPTQGGGQRFLVEYRVQDGCHACAVLAKAIYTFDFDSSGKFLGIKFQKLTAR